MKKMLTILCLVNLITSGYSKNGLEKIILEKYYVSNEDDSIGSSGTLPVGSITYRIFADMLPGYKFLDAYGSPTHPLIMKTSTTFFNNTDFGNYSPVYSKHNASKNTVMLDSWLSTGGACGGEVGVLKSDDNDGTIDHTLLQNTDTSAGISLNVEDGMIPGTVPSFLIIGLTNETDVFNDGSANGNIFTTTGGAWACLEGAQGPDSATNRVLIAQITTKGKFYYELNLNIGTPAGGIELYVAKNPDTLKNEHTIPHLIDSVGTDSVVHTVINKIRSSESVLKVYPNPASKVINLSIDVKGQQKNYNYKIIDLTGRVILSKYINSIYNSYSEKIDITSIANGFYAIVLSRDGKILSTHKISKQ
jgi:hypothetical protein